VSLAVKLIDFVLNSGNSYYWADMIVSRWTNLYARNPDLNVLAPRKFMDRFYMLQAAILPFVYASKLLEAEGIAYASTVCSVVSGFVLYLSNPSGGCNNTKDACALALILLVSSVLAHLRAICALLYLSNFVLGLNGGLRRLLIRGTSFIVDQEFCVWRLEQVQSLSRLEAKKQLRTGGP
jgi:hypothetical protein